jgi:uncharacterized protein (TIGR03083 family)
MDAPAVDLDHTLALLTSEVEALNRRIAGLTAGQWSQQSSCPGWRVADLVMHVVRNGEAFLQFSQHALRGDQTRPPGFAYPDRDEEAAGLVGPDGALRDVEIRNLGPRGCAELQAKQLRAYARLLTGLTEADKSKTGVWAACHRTIPWGARQRLAEVAYHHWDVRRSLGDYGPMEDAIASQMLAYRLEPAHSPLFRYQPAHEAKVQTFRLRSADGRAWRVSVSDDAVPATELGWELSDLALTHFQVNGPPVLLPAFQETFTT